MEQDSSRGLKSPESFLLTAPHSSRGTLFLSLCFTFPTQFFQGDIQLETHECEYNPVGLSGSGFLQAPYGNSNGLSRDV